MSPSPLLLPSHKKWHLSPGLGKWKEFIWALLGGRERMKPDWGKGLEVGKFNASRGSLESSGQGRKKKQAMSVER